MKKYKAELKHDFVEALLKLINNVFVQIGAPEDDDHRMFLAALAEIDERIQARTIIYKKKYKISFTPVQAFALRLLFTSCIEAETIDYTTNRMMQISNEINQFYS